MLISRSMARNWMLILKSLAYNWVEIIIALALLFYCDLKWFLLFWFLQRIYSSAGRTHALRRLIRVFQVANECKIMAIMKKLGISEADATAILEEAKAKMTEKEWKDLERDLEDSGVLG
jgi:hypothetical protein